MSASGIALHVRCKSQVVNDNTTNAILNGEKLMF